MLNARGQARGRVRVTRASIATGVVTAILVAAATAGTASATSIAQKKAQAAAAEAQLTQLQNAAEKKVEAYDLVHQRYQNTLKALHRNQQTLNLARQNLRAAQRQLALSLTADYKSGNQDALSYVLAARSIGDLVDQVQVLQRSTGVSKTLLRQITNFQTVVVRRGKLLEKQKKQVKRDQATAKAQRDAARASVDREQAYFNSLKASIRNMIAAQQAAAAAAAAAQAAPAGSTGTYTGPTRRPARWAARRWRSPSSTWACRTCGAGPARPGSTARAWSCTCTRSWVCRCRTTPPPSTPRSRTCPLSDLQPGDLVFFYGLGHVGIYVGNGTMIHAPHTGTVVQFGLDPRRLDLGAARVPG